MRFVATTAFLLSCVLGAVPAGAVINDPGPPCDDIPGGGNYCPGFSRPTKPNKIIYLHGRSQVDWPCSATLGGGSAANWDHRLMQYDGSAKLFDWGPRGMINDELQRSCNAPNQCVVMCFSAGCARLLVSLDDLLAVNKMPNRILWIQAAASAAGGSEIAKQTTGGGLETIFAKLTGSQAKVDFDLWPEKMRNNYGYIQNRAPVAMLHVAGRKNVCKNFLFGLVKVCGNRYFPREYGDGVVPMHSSCGFSNSFGFENCNTPGAKYTNRLTAADPSYYNTHLTILGPAVQNASVRLALTPYLPPTQDFPEPPVGSRECNPATPECDQPEWRHQLPCILRSNRAMSYSITTGDTWPGGTPRDWVRPTM